MIRTYTQAGLDELNRRMIEHEKQSDEEIKEQIAEFEMLVEILKADIEVAA